MTNRGGGRSCEGGVAWGLATAKIHAKIGEQARAKVKKRNETWEKTQHQPQTGGQMGKWAKEVQGGGRGLPGMAPAHATRCGSSAASIEIPNNRVECTCTACAATRHKKKQKVKREESPKTKILREKMQKCATKRSEIRGRGVMGGKWQHWWVEPSKRGSAAAQSWRSEMQQQQPRHLHALQ